MCVLMHTVCAAHLGVRTIELRACVCVHARVCAPVCVCVCVYVCVCA